MSFSVYGPGLASMCSNRRCRGADQGVAGDDDDHRGGEDPGQDWIATEAAWGRKSQLVGTSRGQCPVVKIRM